MTTVKVGDKVRVYTAYGGHGWKGEVVKVDRKLVTISYARGEDEFRLSTGFIDGYYKDYRFVPLTEDLGTAR